MKKSIYTARRMADIAPFHVMDLLAQAQALEAQGRSIVHMEIGEPDFSTPAPIIEAGIEALRRAYTHYTPAVGLPALREALSKFYFDRYGVQIPARRIVITPGASGALQLVMGVLINPGDRLLLADPGYPCNRHFVRQYEGQPESVPVDATTHYQLTPELVNQFWNRHTIGTLLATPSNPTGTLIPEYDLQAISQRCAKQGGFMIVDEIYHGLVYDVAVTTAANLGEHVFVINSFSKFFGMTGWRLGWIVAPEAYVRELDKLAQNIFLAAATPSQYAALAAFKDDTLEILDQRRAEFQRRRDFLLPALRALGFEFALTPQGAFYLYASCEKFTDDSYAFSRRLLAEAGVAITPGIDFGRYRANQHVRFAYTTSMEQLEEGVSRLEKYLGVGQS
jgi:aspartate/methionine/tyrosine aminotransferase